MIDAARNLWRFAMKGIACEADDAEQAWKALFRALFGPVERRALGVRIDESDALAKPSPLPGKVQPFEFEPLRAGGFPFDREAVTR